MPKLLLSFLLIGSLSFSYGHDDIEIEIYYCNFDIAEFYVQNSSFSILVHFNLNDEGKPVNINTYVPLLSEINKEVVSRKEIITCMNKWRIKGLPKKTVFIAKWSWRHGDGWGPLKIIGPGFKQTIYAQPR